MSDKAGPYRTWRSIVVSLSLILALLMVFASVSPVSGDPGGKGKAKGHSKVLKAPPGYKHPTTKLQHEPKNIKGGQKVGPEKWLKHVKDPIEMKLLVISADGQETDLPAIKAALDRIGVPYEVFIATQTPFNWQMLWDGWMYSYYQGVILTTGNLTYYNQNTGQWESAFTDYDWLNLYEFESAFGIRQVTSYTYPAGPPDNYGLNLVTYQDTSVTPLTAQLTDQGKQVFSYLNPNAQINIKGAWTYLARIINPAVTTPLITTPDGYAIASINHYPDGRENLTITAANNPELLHSMLLSYGIVNWVTKGLFLGERHVNLNAQVDDLLIDDDIWDTVAMTDTTGLTYRMTGSDFASAISWQNRVRSSNSNTAALRLEMAFNGEGATGIYTPDTLTPAVTANQANFNWVNHTYSHPNLDGITYTLALNELRNNHNLALNTLHLTNYFKDAFVQPDISGLSNPDFLRAAKDFGLKYLISDTSRAGWNNPSPNAGFYSTYQPSILIIPRRPTNLFYNLTTPAEWVSEYNCYYGPTGTCAGGAWRWWDHDLTYAEILDKESDMILSYLLKFDLDPLMFHQANLRAYDGTKSLFGDLLDATFQKYNSLYKLPIRNQSEHQTGIKMANRMAYNASGVKALVEPCQSMTVWTTKSALVPITGVADGPNQEVYGGQSISYFQIGAGWSTVVMLPACP